MPVERVIDGFLLVTPEEHEMLTEFAVEESDVRGSRFGDIPVLVVKPNEPLHLPSGRVAIYALGAIYVMPREPSWPTPIA
jgi:hypothetical protein